MKTTYSRALSLLLTLIMVAFIAPALASADTPSDEALERFSGTYNTLDDRASMEARIERGILNATDGMNFIARPIARNRLRAITSPCMSFTFSFDDENVTYRCGDQAPHVSPIDGSAVRRAASGDREAHVLTHEVEEDRIIQTMRSDDGGVRETVFELDLTGTALRATTTISSGQLDQPVIYVFEYLRQ